MLYYVFVFVNTLKSQLMRFMEVFAEISTHSGFDPSAHIVFNGSN